MNPPDSSPTIAEKYPVEARRMRWVLGLTAVLLGVGLVTPIITTTKFVVIRETFSILTGVIALLTDGQLFLFAVITGFSVVLPILKLGVLYKLLDNGSARSEGMQRYLTLMHLYGKWSMLDVFVVAVLVVTVKLGMFASVEMRFGLYAFAAAALLSMYVTARVVHLTDACVQSE